jgi:acyl carrier protein
MSKNAEIREFLLTRIREKSKLLDVTLEPDALGDDFSLTGTGIFDSMDFMNLISDIEETFQVEIDFSDHDPEVFTTLKGFLDCIKM